MSFNANLLFFGTLAIAPPPAKSVERNWLFRRPSHLLKNCQNVCGERVGGIGICPAINTKPFLGESRSIFEGRRYPRWTSSSTHNCSLLLLFDLCTPLPPDCLQNLSKPRLCAGLQKYLLQKGAQKMDKHARGANHWSNLVQSNLVKFTRRWNLSKFDESLSPWGQRFRRH